jgi:C4-type Zn-finger protein
MNEAEHASTTFCPVCGAENETESHGSFTRYYDVHLVKENEDRAMRELLHEYHCNRCNAAFYVTEARQEVPEDE